MPKGGLIVPKKEWIGKRRFSYKKYFGSPLPIDVPDFQIGTPIIKDQGQDGTCVSFAITSVSEDQEGVELEPSYQWFKDKLKDGGNMSGTNPDDACNTICKLGSIEKSVSPLHLPDDGAVKVSSPASWSNLSALDLDAQVHKKKSWFELDGQGDRFDSIRQILWSHQTEKITCFAGIYFQPEWINGSICEHYGKDRTLPHAIKIFGQETINGVPYLMVQNSWGKGHGKNGIYYFSREVVNNLVFARGFFDVNPDDVKNAQWGILEWVKDWLLKKWKIWFPDTPVPVEKKINTMDKTKNLETFCTSIQEFEGWAQGSRSYRNCNPGNLKFTDYIKSLGATTADKDGFAQFPSYIVGFNALKSFVKSAAMDELKSYHDCTILSFFQVYAPSSDNNRPSVYASFVGKKVVYDISTKLKDII